jgi:FkbM family methyltransferase
MLTVLELLRHLTRVARKSPEAMAIDVGAHIGAFARELLDSGLYGRVIAFEPNPANLAELEALAASKPALTLVKKGVGAREGVADFHHDDNTATGSLLPYVAGYDSKGEARTIRVPVVTLDGYLSQQPAPPPVALVKIDTQGHDLAVIHGASATLASDRPFVIAEVIYLPLYEGQSTPESIFEAMAAQGYETYTLFNIHATVEGRMAFADALFVPRELAVPYTQKFEQIDNHVSYQTQIATLDRICAERLEVINVLDAEVKRLKGGRA